MAGRRADRRSGAYRGSTRFGRAADCPECGGNARFIRFCNDSVTEFESGILGRRSSLLLGESVVQHAFADAGLPLLGGYTDRAGAISSGESTADMASPTADAGVGEHAWLVHYRTGSDFDLPGMRAKRVSSRWNRSQELDGEGAGSPGVGVSSVPGCAAGHAVWNETRCVSFSGSILSPGQYGSYPGMAAHAVHFGGRENVPGHGARFFHFANGSQSDMAP